MSELKIVSLNTSQKKGTIKYPVQSVTINSTGIVDDAHSGNWHRQVSLLGTESFDRMTAGKDVKLDYGVFAENITTEGFELHESNIFDRFVHKEVVLEVTQIGKKCHNGCAIMKQIGDCVMPKEGIFCRVIQGGKLKVGDSLYYMPKVIKVHVITLSDRAFNGIYEDKSGPLAEKIMGKFFMGYNRKYKIDRTILPDDPEKIKKAILDSEKEGYDIVITTGGTGIGKRDFTPDVVKSIIDKEIPGIMEHIRLKYGAEKPNALISRSVAGVLNSTLIYAIPGSTKGVHEYLTEISKTVEHSLRMLSSIDSH